MQTLRALLKSWIQLNLILKASYTKQYQKHTPSGFCYFIKCFDDKVYKQDPVIYTKQSEDEDVAQTFVQMLEKDITWIYENCGKAKMIFTPEQQKAFQKATKCWICRGKFVRDKNHRDYKDKRAMRDHVITLVNTEVQPITSVICNAKSPSLPPLYFIT